MLGKKRMGLLSRNGRKEESEADGIGCLGTGGLGFLPIVSLTERKNQKAGRPTARKERKTPADFWGK